MTGVIFVRSEEASKVAKVGDIKAQRMRLQSLLPRRDSWRLTQTNLALFAFNFRRRKKLYLQQKLR